MPGLNSEPTQLAGCGVQGSVEKVRIVGVVEKSELWDTAARLHAVAVGEAVE